MGWLEKLSPFAYYEGCPLLITGGVDLMPTVVHAGSTVVTLGLATRGFELRDLVS